MIDIRFLRENPDVVKQNIRNKFQDSKLPLVDEVIALDEELRQNKKHADDLRANRNKISKSIGALMGQKKFEEAEEAKKLVAQQAAELAECEQKEAELSEKVQKIMMIIPNIIDPTVPIGKDDSENVEVERFGEPLTPAFEVPYVFHSQSINPKQPLMYDYKSFAITNMNPVLYKESDPSIDM